MAELDVGRHCAAGDCGRLDFLPFVCSGCGKVFCLEHRGKDDHKCTEATSSRAAPAGGSAAPASYACGVPGCSARELLPVLCAHCSLQLCLRHRHQADHACVNLRAVAPRMQRTQQLVQSITEANLEAAGTGKLDCLQVFTERNGPHLPRGHVARAARSLRRRELRPARVSPRVEAKRGDRAGAGRRGARSAAVTARVQLMKTKQQAVGERGIPQEERLYLRVRLPRGAGVSGEQRGEEGREEEEGARAVFVSRVWSVGRVVDWIASATRLPNNNQLADAKKLRLCDVATGHAWAMDVRMDSLLLAPGTEGGGTEGGGPTRQRLADGAHVVLEYLDPGCDVTPDVAPSAT